MKPSTPAPTATPSSTDNDVLILELTPSDSRHLAKLCGQLNEHLQQIERRMAVTIHSRGNRFAISGHPTDQQACGRLLQSLYREAQQGQDIDPEFIHLNLQQAGMEVLADNPQQTTGQDLSEPSCDGDALIHTKKATIKPRGGNQLGYVRSVMDCDINFGIGPAGTGKTYLAVACAVQSLLNEEVQRILLVRPAVEAGEKLGFLPGDLAQKIDPYLRPLYDALYEMLGVETVTKMIERNIIEIAPLAFMRGRTLNDSFIILDESQNTTREQMKMFLTRIGFGSTAVITGDASQIDLPKGCQSGLTHAIHVLDGVEGISFTYFQSKDVVRHPMVQRIVDAYDRIEGNSVAMQHNQDGHPS